MADSSIITPARISTTLSASENAELAAARTSLTMWAMGPVLGSWDAEVLTDPVVTAVTTSARSALGRSGIWVSWCRRLVTSRPLTIDPSARPPRRRRPAPDWC